MSSPPAPAPAPTPDPKAVRRAKISRFDGAFWGMFIADAMAMPVHYYYNLAWLKQYHGWVTDYSEPKNPHPESTLFRERYEPVNATCDVLRGQAEHWKKPGVHFHQFLAQGENTLDVKLAAALMESLAERGGYDRDDYLKRYLDFMLTEGRHRDTYVEVAHRQFFQNYGRGKDPLNCGVETQEIGGLTLALPIALFYANDLDAARHHVRQHLALTHPGETMAGAGAFVAELMHFLLAGDNIRTTLFKRIGRDSHPALAFSYEAWQKRPDDDIVGGGELSASGKIEEALPASIFLMWKYRRDLERGILANANLGGDNCGRGAILGAALGALLGCEAIPGMWVTGLAEVDRYEALIDRVLVASGFLD